jgi:hypothetical protein
MLRNVARAETTLQLEHWASWLLGEMWTRRKLVPADCPLDWEYALGRVVVDEMAAIGGRNARTALETIARMDRGELGGYAFELACELREHELPEHVAGIRRAVVVQAFSALSPGDGEAMFLEVSAGEEDEGHTVAAFIDEQLGGIAKRLYLVRNLGEWEAGWTSERADGDPRSDAAWRRMDPQPVAPGPACRRLREAIMLTDLYLSPPVADGYPDLRALAFARACSVA